MLNEIITTNAAIGFGMIILVVAISVLLLLIRHE